MDLVGVFLAGMGRDPYRIEVVHPRGVNAVRVTTRFTVLLAEQNQRWIQNRRQSSWFTSWRVWLSSSFAWLLSNAWGDGWTWGGRVSDMGIVSDSFDSTEPTP
jgi:hypothetical protein